MRLTRVALRLVAAAAVILGMGTPPASADVTVPNQYATVVSSTAGLNTFIRDVGAPRTGQLLIHANQLTGLVGQSIDGVSFRLFSGATVPFPATAATWSDYTIRVGPGVALGAQTTTFASNFSGASTVVRTGALTIPASAFTTGALPNPFGTFIAFQTPFPYTGGNLLIEVRHSGSNITNNAANDFMEAALTTDPGFGVQFWSATALTATSTTGTAANFTVARLRGVAAQISAGDTTVTEGNSGTTNAFVPVTLAAASATPVTVNFATANGTATAGTDYTATTGTLTFAPGTTALAVTVSVTGDTTVEANETFFVNLTNPVGGTITDAQGQGTITNDDFATINAGDASQAEGNSGSSDLIVPVTLSEPSLTPVTVAFATADGTATAGSDYVSTSGVLTFAPGTTALGVTVSVNGDTAPEADETFFVNLSGAVGGTLGDAQGVGTILNDDGAAFGDENAELSHGVRINANLASGANDTDTYPISQNPYSSYEVVVDGASADIQPVALERLDATSTVIQTSVAVGNGQSRSLRWQNNTGTVVADQTVRVSSGDCQTNCGPDDVYRLRAYETTYAIPRFNNSGSQITVLILQNPTDYPISTNAYFWAPDGTLLHTLNKDLVAKEVYVVVTASIPQLQTQAGSVTVNHTGRFGDLAGKAVALEPATGFSFDSPMLVRTR